MKQSWKRISLISLLVLCALALSVFVVACGGGNSSSTSAQNPTPSITNISPSSAPTGSNSQSITITGTGFLTNSTVTYSGGAHTSTYVNASQLTISLTAADLATAGSYPVVVTNPAPGGGASAAVNFTVVTNNPVPAITTLSPASLSVGATPQTLTINGTGFVAASTVTFNGVAHTSAYVNATQLTIALTATDLATVGNYPVVVTNPPPGGGTSASVAFGVWSTITNSSSSLTFSLPPLGAPPQVTYSGSSSYQLFALEIAAPNPHYNNAVTPVITIFALSNPSKETIQQWFEDNVDDASGTLLASGAFQLQQLTNGPAMVSVGPIPSTYQGGPIAAAYMLAPSQDEVYGITQSQSAQLTEFGYASSSASGILTSILGGIH